MSRFELPASEQPRNVVTYERGNERYVFVWTDDQWPELTRTMGRYASDPGLSFSWADMKQLLMELKQPQG